MSVHNQIQRQSATTLVANSGVSQRRDEPSRNISLPAERFMAGSSTLSFLEPAPFIRQRGCVVERFTDNVLVTPNNLLYADQNYFLRDIASFQVVKFSCRKSALYQKFVNLLSSILITIGLILFFSPTSMVMHIIGVALVVLNIGYLGYFYWRLLHQKTGEYGLLIHFQSGQRRVITSHSLRAIQHLFQSLLQCLERPEETNNFVSVNMYTGDLYTQ